MHLPFVTSAIGVGLAVVSGFLFLVLIGIAIQHPGSFFVTVGLVIYALYRWAKSADARSKPIVYLDNPYLDRGTPPADVVAKQEGKRTSLD